VSQQADPDECNTYPKDDQRDSDKEAIGQVVGTLNWSARRAGKYRNLRPESGQMPIQYFPAGLRELVAFVTQLLRQGLGRF